MFFNGYKVFSNDLLTDRVYTKKQTRKFKNKRWNKKYVKMHSYEIPKKDFLVSETTKSIFGHPAMIQHLRLQRMDTDNCFML